MDADSLDRYLPLRETIAPSDSAAVADVVRRAAESAETVYPMGGGTALEYGPRPTRAGLGLSLAGLDRVVDYPSRDLTITVEAGMTVAALQKTLAAERQRLPVDVPLAERATVGGAIAAAAEGPGRFRWGTLRDYVLGLRAVDGAGMEFAAGGRVVKNAAGYNLCRLMVGSLGTLGVVTQATLMVRPLPVCSRWIVCGVADFAMAERLLADLVHTETLPTAIEWLVGPAWAANASLADCGPASTGWLVVGFEGTEAEVDWMLDSLAGQWRRAGVGSAAVIGGDHSESFRRELADFSAGPDDTTSGVVVRITVLPSAVVPTVAQFLLLLPDASIQAHAGDGVIVARLHIEIGAVVPMLRDLLRPLVDDVGGALVVLRGPAEAELDAATVWGPPPPGFDAMRAIKRQFDPKNILNPGRFIFGA
jgi:glycolate oxidase FAD binding subunit